MSSIYKRGSKWRGQDLIGGRRVSVTGRTKKEVSEKLAEMLTDYNRGIYVFENGVTVREWTDLWLDRKAVKVTEQTNIRFRSLFENHLYPYLGDVQLQDLTRNMIEEAYARSFFKKAGKNYSETEYARSTVNALSFQFKTCLQSAVDEGLIGKNPHNGVELHKLRPSKKIHAYTREEHEKIVEYTKNGSSLYWIMYFLIATGVRVGEACALTWDDVDLKQRTVNITKTAVSIHGSMLIQDSPKTAQSARTVHLTGNTVKWLEEVRKSQNMDLNFYNLVFPTKRYTVQNPSNLRKYWAKACAEMNIPYYGLHALRHTYATRALEENINVKIVSDMLGHKNVITTMNIYQETLDDHMREMTKKINALY